MRSASKYMSAWFIETLWPVFEKTLKNKKTKEDYFSVACYLCDYVKKDFTEITPSEAQGYFDHLMKDKGMNLTIKTIYTKLGSLRSISEYIVKNHDTLGISETFRNVFFDVKLEEELDLYYTREDIPTKDELNSLMDMAREHSEQMFLILALILRCSLTVTEICKLEKNMIRIDADEQWYIAIQEEKGIRNIFVPQDVAPYLSAAGYRAHASGKLFSNERSGPLSVRNLQRYYADMIKDTELEGRFSLKDLRTASVAYMLAGGANREDVANYTDTDGRWLYRFNKVIPELKYAPCHMSSIRIV